MSPELQKKITKAEKLRTKAAFPLSLITEPDYVEAGDLYCEIARECSDLEDKIKFYNEAAITFLRKKAEYNEYRASECYKKLFELLVNQDVTAAVENYIKYCECLERIEKYMLAGQGYTKIGDILEEIDGKRAIEMYRKAQDAYSKDYSCPMHYKEAVQKCLTIQIKGQDIEGAIESLKMLDIEFSKLCIQILTLLLGKTNFEEDLKKDESELIMTLLNKDRDTSIESLRQFKEKNFINPIISKIFDFAIDRLQPENDIC
ncbi:uncharacterized protein VICG_01447 [Vittaforma corneae ATCC 50505]|uniref:Vesicular-fusion protein SEC17 n=1 Tax=Vittaforma corneae (strain ATCC 50505) TaxID=993615 RepID=L2GKQ2_VITCO|nr:uncharacterized protein VICG_01447 [Vittaforma corneae ATCC 50505]ELA41463.1 hypothetical protein VICG_01447 [Vittaforma corneae ATCC 50505]